MKRWNTIRRLLLPFALIIIGIGLLGGCLYIPGRDNVPPSERDMKKLVGSAKTKLPIRVGHSVREDVLRIAGFPNNISENGQSWTYAWSAQNGGWFMPLCFAVDPAWRHYTLTLDFTEDGRLKQSRIKHEVQEFNPFGSGRPSLQREYVNPSDPSTPTTRPTL